MDTTQCIDNATWERYAAKTLSPAQLLSLQQHAEGCELCADIKEGIDAMAHPEALAATVEEINAEVDEYVKPRRRKTLALWYWSAAAAVVAAVGISVFVLNREKITPTQPISQKQEQPVTAPLPQSDTGHKEIAWAVPEKKVQKKTAPETKRPKANKKRQVPVKDTDPVGTDADDFAPFRGNVFRVAGESTTDDVQLEKDLAIADTAQHKTLTYRNKDTLPDTLAVLAKIPENVDYKFDFAGKEIVVVGSASAIKHKYTTSATLPANISNSYTTFNNNVNANNVVTATWMLSDSLCYNNALSYFNQKKYDSCLQNLEPLVYTVGSEYYEDALMLKAQTFLSQNRKAEAKEALRTIIRLKKKRHKEAKRLMDAIE